MHGRADSVDLLLTAGADPTAKSNLGESVLEWAKRHPAILDQLHVAIAQRLRKLLQEILVPLPPARPYFDENILDEIVKFTVKSA